jgi:hypothetical protein
MADRPRGDDWWLASDGKWYPPELSSQPLAYQGDVDTGADPTTEISPGLTTAVSVLVGIASGLMVVVAFFGFRYASELSDLGADASSVTRDPTPSEIAFAGWLLLAGLVLVAAAVTSLVWVFTASRAGDARGATTRSWRGGWAVGVWFIPLANLVLPKLLFNELERIFQVPFRGVPIEDSWRQESRTQLADLWWALWVAGSVVSLSSWFLSPSDVTSGEALGSSVTLTSITLVLTAVAGVLFALVVRRIEVFSRR